VTLCIVLADANIGVGWHLQEQKRQIQSLLTAVRHSVSQIHLLTHECFVQKLNVSLHELFNRNPLFNQLKQ